MIVNFIGILLGAAGIIFGIHAHQPLFLLGGIAIFAVGFVRQFRANAKAEAEGRAEIKSTDTQLRADLIACHKLAIAKLGSADDATQTKVIDLLIEAGKHLGHPYTNSRIVYDSGYFVNWNNEGIAIVAQAKKLIEDIQPRA